MNTRSLVTGAVVISLVLVLGVGLAGATIDEAATSSGTIDEAGTSTATIDAATDPEANASATASRTFGTERPDPGQTVGVTATVQLDSQDNVSYVDEFSPEFASANLVSVTADGNEISPSFTIVGSDTVVVVLNDVEPAQIQITYEVTVPSDAAPGTSYSLDSTVDLDEGQIPVSGPSQMTVPGGSPSFEVAIDSIEEEVSAGETVSVDATVTNTGNVNESQEVAFSIDGTQEDSQSVTLDSGESEQVSFSYGTSPEDVPEIDVAVASENDTASRTVSVLGDATFEVAIDSIDEEVTAGEEVSVVAAVTNTGDVSGTQSIAFSVDGDQEGSETVALDSGESTQASFSYATGADDVPTLEVGVESENETATRTVTVLGQFEVEIDEVNGTVAAGEDVSVSATITNTAEERKSQSITFRVDGADEGSETVTLDSGESQQVSFSYETSEDDTPEIMVAVASEDDTAESRVTVVGDFEVAIDSIDEEVVAGENVSVSATVTNSGDETGSQEIALRVDRTAVATESVTLSSGESKQVSFSYRTAAEDVPEVDVAVASEDDIERQLVTVLERATFAVDIEAVAGEVVAGETVTVEYLVENTGDLEGTQEINFSVDGTVAATETVTLAGDETFADSVDYETVREDAPAIELAVTSENDTETRTVTVTSPGTLQVVDVDPAGPVVAGESLDVAVTVANDGETEATGTVSLAVENADGDVLDRVESSATVDPGDSETLTMTYDTGPDDPPSVFVRAETANSTSDRIEATVQQQSGSDSLAVRIDTVADEVTAGETVTVEYTVENVGDTETTETIAVSVDGERVDSTNVTLGGGETRSLATEYQTAPSDTPEVEVAVAGADGTASRTVTVLESSGTATFDVSIDESGTDGSVDAGETASITALVENTGSVEGTREVRFSVDGVTQDRQTVTLGGGESETVSFSYRADDGDAPEVSLQVVAGGSVSGGTIAVDAGDDATPSDDDSGPGFGVGVVLLSLLVLVLGGRYRSRPSSTE